MWEKEKKKYVWYADTVKKPTRAKAHAYRTNLTLSEWEEQGKPPSRRSLRALCGERRTRVHLENLERPRCLKCLSYIDKAGDDPDD